MTQSFRQILGAEPSQVDVGNSALIIIDAQNEYAEGKLAVSNAAASRKVIASLLSKYRKRGGHVVHVLHQVPEGAPVFTPDSHLAEEFDELAPVKGETVIKKQAPSSFTGTSLAETLEGAKVKQIVLVGYMAHVCVTGTARAGMEAGYDVVVVEDAIGDRDVPGATGAELVKMVLVELADAIATVVKSSDIA